VKRIAIIGAGQLGSRHLQALQAVAGPLAIDVVDPSETSLSRARQRWEEVDQGHGHTIGFGPEIEGGSTVDLAIVATNADTRLAAVQTLLSRADVRYLLLEKLLFARRQDADALVSLGKRTVTTWVNCPMRIMPPYEEIRQELGIGPIRYRVTGSRYGLVTNAIHYLDHVAHLSGCTTFELELGDLDSHPVPSKRDGFIELTGALTARFSDGSRCDVVCHAEGDAPVVVEIFTARGRYIVREDAGLMWASRADDGWQWCERPARIPYQSELTAHLVEELRITGATGLTPLDESVQLHLQLLEPLRAALDARGVAAETYPFT